MQCLQSMVPSFNQYSLGVDKCLLLLALNETQLWHMDKHNNNIISGGDPVCVCLLASFISKVYLIIKKANKVFARMSSFCMAYKLEFDTVCI